MVFLYSKYYLHHRGILIPLERLCLFFEVFEFLFDRIKKACTIQRASLFCFHKIWIEKCGKLARFVERKRITFSTKCEMSLYNISKEKGHSCGNTNDLSKESGRSIMDNAFLCLRFLCGFESRRPFFH